MVCVPALRASSNGDHDLCDYLLMELRFLDAVGIRRALGTHSAMPKNLPSNESFLRCERIRVRMGQHPLPRSHRPSGSAWYMKDRRPGILPTQPRSFKLKVIDLIVGNSLVVSYSRVPKPWQYGRGFASSWSLAVQYRYRRTVELHLKT